MTNSHKLRGVFNSKLSQPVWISFAAIAVITQSIFSLSLGSLIRSGAVTSAVDERGETPLHVAAAMGRRAVAQTLLLFDADIDHR